MRTLLPALLPTLLLCLFAAAVMAQEKPAATATAVPAATPQKDPFAAFNKRMYSQISAWVLKSAEKMPEDGYALKPGTTDVRSFGQLIGHVADANYMFCSTASGEKNPMLMIELNKTTKADLIASLKDAFAYCDKTYDGMTDAAGMQTVKFFGSDTLKTNLLTVNIVHTTEHYGNIVTYLRLKNIVPPSTEQMGDLRPKPPTAPKPAATKP
jgi:uncharacterized damage-inducible protein DinB